MRSITTQPEALFSAAEYNAATASPTAAVFPAAIHQVFASTLSAGGELYAATDADNAVVAG